MAPSANSDPRVTPTKVTTGYKALFMERFMQYKHQTPAAGLFYKSNSGQPSVRVEATDIRKEFVDVAEFGTDPEGNLFYNDLSKLNGPVDYRFWYNTDVTDDEAAVVAQFYVKGATEFIAEFIGKDPARVVKDIVSGHTGHWRPFDFQENTATVTKSANDSTVTLRVAVSGQVATWSVASNASRVSINQAGRVLIKNSNAIGAGQTSYVDYDDDRILFYPNVHSPDFSVVFLPLIPDGGDVHALKGQIIGTTGANRTRATWT